MVVVVVALLAVARQPVVGSAHSSTSTSYPRSVSSQIWDTAADYSRFRHITTSYYRGAHVRRCVRQCVRLGGGGAAVGVACFKYSPRSLLVIPVPCPTYRTQSHSPPLSFVLQAVLVVYNVGDRASFGAVPGWMEQLEQVLYTIHFQGTQVRRHLPP